MSVDRYEEEYHLTPRGWEKGDSFYYGRPTKNLVPPQDRVRTMANTNEQSSRFSPPTEGWVEKWRSSDEAEVDRLLKQFGSRPVGL
jgi:hypothetical protein